MNVERLHAIVVALRKDLVDTRITDRMGDLATALTQLGNDPNQPSYQESVANARNALRDALASSAVDKWPATWRETLDEIGLGGRLGSNLQAKVDAAVLGNEMTPAAAATEVRALADGLNGDNDVLRNLEQGLNDLNIGAEELAANEAEVIVTIPRAEVRENLPDLGQEFRTLNRILGPFEEIETGTRAPFKVRSIGSSDYGLYLYALPVVAASIAKGVSWVLDSYLTILKIREARQALKEGGIDDAHLAELDDAIEAKMSDKIEEYVDQYMTEKYGTPELVGREHELKLDLTLSLNAIANRIDHGYNFDVRAGEETEDDEPDNGSDAEALTVIRKISPRLKYVNRAGGVLELPEAEPPVGEDVGSA